MTETALVPITGTGNDIVATAETFIIKVVSQILSLIHI